MLAMYGCFRVTGIVAFHPNLISKVGCTSVCTRMKVRVTINVQYSTIKKEDFQKRGISRPRILK